MEYNEQTITIKYYHEWLAIQAVTTNTSEHDKHATWDKINNLLARNRDNVSGWSGMSTPGLLY
jgi:hypothetical protein